MIPRYDMYDEIYYEVRYELGQLVRSQITREVWCDAIVIWDGTKNTVWNEVAQEVWSETWWTN